MVKIGQGTTARVLVAEPTGGEMHQTLQLTDQTLTAVSRDRLDVRAGAAVEMSINQQSAHLAGVDFSPPDDPASIS
jgi:hypothetical protein